MMRRCGGFGLEALGDPIGFSFFENVEDKIIISKIFDVIYFLN